jgi:hypothetical protein
MGHITDEAEKRLWREGPWVKLTLRGHVVGTTEIRETTATKLARIAKLSTSDSLKRFDSLMHLFNEGTLAVCFHSLEGKKAVGVDGD